MTKAEALSYFGNSVTQLADALDISKQAVCNWPDNRPIPKLREKQLQYEILPKLGVTLEKSA